MYKLIIFFASLAVLLFVSLYTPYHGQLVIIFSQQKISMDLWFALILLVLFNLLVFWVIRQLSAFQSIARWFKSKRQHSRNERYQLQKQRAVVAALAKQYDQAVYALKSTPLVQTSDQIMYITWLNKTSQREQLEEALSKLGQEKNIKASWMIWFRAYLFHAQGRQDMALQFLLDALEKGLYSKQMIRSAVQYADIKQHYQQLLSIEKEIRSVFKYEAIDILSECYECFLMLLLEQDTAVFVKQVEHLPADLIKQDRLLFYQLQALYLTDQHTVLEQKLMNVSLVVDKRILPLLIDLKSSVDAKVRIIQNALLSEPNHPDLLYVLSYLNAHNGQEQDALKLIGQAVESSLGVKIPPNIAAD
ncbi:hypothetical protein OAT84_00295 [Gammaproteobacteria bacterium]|nr:hypothetical protein [Gammaproteobacteria bacterium]